MSTISDNLTVLREHLDRESKAIEVLWATQPDDKFLLGRKSAIAQTYNFLEWGSLGMVGLALKIDGNINDVNQMLEANRQALARAIAHKDTDDAAMIQNDINRARGHVSQLTEILRWMEKQA